MKKLLFLTLALFTSLTFSQSLRVGKFDQLTTNDPAGTEVEISKDVYINSTGGLYLPEGTTLERPTPFQDGMLRYNSDLGAAEIYSVGEWKPVGSGGISLWETAKAYKIDDVVIESDLIYRALTDHTSGTFATDLANGDWTEVSALPQPLDTTDSPTFNNVTITDPDYDISNLGKEIAFNQSTGVRSGGDLSVDVDPTKFDMAALEAQIIDSTVNGAPTRNEFTCPAFNAQTVTNLATQDVTYILVDASCTLTQQASFPSASERRAKAFVGRLNHSNRTSVLFANTIADFLQSPMSQVYDLMNSLGAFNIGDGNKITANGANLSMNKSAGEMFVASYNYATNNQSPNNVTNAARTLFSFRYATQTTLSGSTVTVLDPTNYDNAGTITAIGGGSSTASVQRVYLFPSNNLTVQYGQTTYSNLAAAVQGVQSETFVVTPTSKGLAIPVAFIAIQKNCTSLLDTTCAKIITPPQFGGTAGTSVGGSTTIQQAYVNSSQPQITTDSTRGALQIKRGSLLDSDNVFEVLNGAGSATFYVKGNGDTYTLGTSFTSDQIVTGTIAASEEITGSNLSGTNTGDLNSRAQAEGADAVINKLEVKNRQLTTTATGARLLELGSNNELANPNFEATTVDSGWTVTNATAAEETASPIDGKKSLKLTLSGALSLTQASTINAAKKVGVQMVAFVMVNSADVSDLQLCSTKNGSEDKCTAQGGYAQGSGSKLLTVSFLGDGTSNGLKLKSTDTTGTVLVDLAYVGIGSPIVDFTPDMVYSAKVSDTGAYSADNTNWISSSSRSSTGTYTINFSTGTFTIAPNCVATAWGSPVGYPIAEIQSVTASAVTVIMRNNGSGSNLGFNLICQKTGADYKTSKAYVASSSDYGYTNAGTITIGATTTAPTKGTVVTDRIWASRDGQRLKAIYQYDQTTGGSNGSGEYLYTLPSSLSFDSSVVSFYTGAQFGSADAKAVVGWGKADTGANTSTSIVLVAYDATRFRAYIAESSSVRGFQGSAYFSLSGAHGFYFNIDAPISGWQDSSVIVGSFQGYNETPGTSRVETFSFSYGTTNATTVCSASPCSYLDQIGSNVSSLARNSTGNYTLNLSKTYSKLKCTLNASNSGGYPTLPEDLIQCSSCNSVTFRTWELDPNPATGDSRGIVNCQGIPQ